MSGTLERVLGLVGRGEVRISQHGYDELSEHNIAVRDVVDGATYAQVVEDYPEYPKGPCVLALQKTADGIPIHVVWGIPRGESSPAVLVTAYRPDPERWTDDFLRRKP